VGKKRRVMGLPPSVRAGAGGCVALRGWVRSARSLRLVCTVVVGKSELIQSVAVMPHAAVKDRTGGVRYVSSTVRIRTCHPHGGGI
jgi:hypothetical protein